ncbi:MAG: SRPBCC family protein [Solirubrobacterales bacterium]
MGMSWAEHSVEIEAPIETSFAAIVDYESFPHWQQAVDSVEVLDRYADGLGHRVRLFVDAKVRKIDYVLAYGYDRPTEISWDFVEGNGMRDADGLYTFEELGPERTRATYRLGADPELPVPGMIVRRTHKQLVKRSAEDLKAEAERRHAAGEAPDESAPEAPAPSADEEPAGAGIPGREAEEMPNEAGPGREAEEMPDEAGPGRKAEEMPGGAKSDWVPKAEREATSRPGPEPAAGPGSPGPPGPEELAAALLDKAVSTGRDVTEGVVRAGIGAAESAIGIGREVSDGLIRRVNRKLGADRDDRDDDR